MAQYVEVTEDHGELRLYTKGKWVVWAQQLLQWWGWSLGPKEADGYFGPHTAAAVTAFQRDKGLSDTGVVDTETWTALEAPKIVFDKYPVTNGDMVEWTIRNDGFAARAAGGSAGHVTVYDRNSSADVVPEARTPQDAELAPGGTFGAAVDLVATFPPDGEYTAQVRLEHDAALVDFDVVGGKVAAPGTFAGQTQPVPSAYPPRLQLDGEPTIAGDEVFFRAENVGPGPLPAGSPVGHYEIHNRDTDAEVVPLQEVKVGQALGPGDSDGYYIPLYRLTPNDGKYALSLWVGDPAAKLLNYDVILGKVRPVQP